MIEFKPLDDKLLIQQIDEDSQSAGGIYIPESSKEKPQKGKVIAVGTGRMLDNGQIEPMNIQVDDVIYFAKYGGTDIKLNGVNYKILTKREVLGILG